MMKLTAMAMLMVMMMMKETTAENMKQVNGSLKCVSVGPAGVWGISRGIFYREGTYGTEESAGTNWTYVSGYLSQLEVGTNIVWAVNIRDDIYYRRGISSSNPIGTSWKRVKGQLRHISVNPDGDVWGVNKKEHIFVRVGITKANPAGESWKQIPGILKQISAGRAGVWGVNRKDVYYRNGTFHTSNTEGTGWVKISDMKMIYVSSASDSVIGISKYRKLYIREEMTEDNPIGTGWKPIKEEDFDFMTVDLMSKYIWATKIDNSVWYSY